MWLGATKARPGWQVRRGALRGARCGVAALGAARSGARGVARRGRLGLVREARRVKQRVGLARQARQGTVRCGKLGLGGARQARHDRIC